MNSGALGEMKVIEVCQVMAGPFCGCLLADMGADVIKVENPSLSFIKFLKFFNDASTIKKIGISKSSIIDKSTKIGNEVFIGENVVIGEKCKIVLNECKMILTKFL